VWAVNFVFFRASKYFSFLFILDLKYGMTRIEILNRYCELRYYESPVARNRNVTANRIWTVIAGLILVFCLDISGPTRQIIFSKSSEDILVKF